MARVNDWISVTIKNKKMGTSMTLYHPPGEVSAGLTVDQHLRKNILCLPPTKESDITIDARPSPADWLTAKVPANDVPK